MKKNYRFHYPLGTTTRINVCMVCDDKIGYQADSPERLENYWKASSRSNLTMNQTRNKW